MVEYSDSEAGFGDPNGAWVEVVPDEPMPLDVAVQEREQQEAEKRRRRASRFLGVNWTLVVLVVSIVLAVLAAGAQQLWERAGWEWARWVAIGGAWGAGLVFFGGILGGVAFMAVSGVLGVMGIGTRACWSCGYSNSRFAKVCKHCDVELRHREPEGPVS